MASEGSQTAAERSKPTGLSPAQRDERLQELLVKTSRTFALAIPQLPQPTRREVTVAYLLFRIADTFEDASVLWEPLRRLAALDEFDHLLAAPSLEETRASSRAWAREPPTDHPGYLELLEETPRVFAGLLALDEAAREAIVRHTRRTARLMAEFVTRADENGVLQLEDFADLRAYCYAVAGIVGEMLTDLFLLTNERVAASADYLRSRASAFGEGLQLVNILKDSAADAVEGRNFLPSTVNRSEVFELARADLDAAAEYVTELQQAGASPGLLAFTALPVELAWASLDRIEASGPGSKITREQVFALYAQVHEAIESGRPALRARGSSQSGG